MASKRRLRRKACDGKVKYANVQDAKRAITIMNQKKLKPQSFNIYICKFCRCYHIGHAFNFIGRIQ